ncbi:M10 family metallopeptidase, partial [Yoonia sp. R2331]|uniref:M10 family metallopeptidase n=1 Tax=Yoonia sp. R2331 TaxID=3237238 RepID=UPI0034E5A078
MTSVIDTIDWGTKQDDNVVTVYFVPQGQSRTFAPGETVTSEGFNAYEKAQFQKAFDKIASVSGLTFQIVTGTTAGANADFQMVLDTNEIRNMPEDDQFLGYFNPPGETFEGVGVFNGDLWDRNEGGDLRMGGFGYVTIVHELMHGLGAAHPHDNGGSSTIMQGVTDAFDDYGRDNLNQGVYTTMSYNSGYLTGPVGSAPGFSATYGYEAGPMALDIALLQDLYGTTARNTGNTVYKLPDANKGGTMWRSIWDTKGFDEIRYDGNRDITIDLRPATLQYGEGAGGYISAARGIAGGYTIANGVTIEKAVGGNGDDTIVGNKAANVIVGRNGADVVNAGRGRDTIYGGNNADKLNGNDGRDEIFGGYGNDRITGGWKDDILHGQVGNDFI